MLLVPEQQGRVGRLHRSRALGCDYAVPWQVSWDATCGAFAGLFCALRGTPKRTFLGSRGRRREDNSRHRVAQSGHSLALADTAGRTIRDIAWPKADIPWLSRTPPGGQFATSRPQTAADLLAALYAAIDAAEALLGCRLAEDCVAPRTGEIVPLVVGDRQRPGHEICRDGAAGSRAWPHLSHVRTRHRSPHTNGVVERRFESLKYERLYRCDIISGLELADCVADFIKRIQHRPPPPGPRPPTTPRRLPTRPNTPNRPRPEVSKILDAGHDVCAPARATCRIPVCRDTWAISAIVRLQTALGPTFPHSLVRNSPTLVRNCPTSVPAPQQLQQGSEGAREGTAGGA